MKKIISLILSILIVLSVFSVPAFANDTQSTSSNVNFLRMLEICENENLKDTDILTRIELAKMYYKILTGKSIPEYTEYQSPYFDIGEEEYGYVKTVSEAGIMTGVSSTVFGKNEPVTYVQLIKTIVTLLGYNTHALNKGGWPNGYMAIATNLDITKSAPSDVNFYVTLSGAADVFRLAANSDMVIRTSYDETETYEKYTGAGFLEYYMGIVPFNGVITANSTFSVDGNDVCEYGSVRIGNTLLNVSEKTVGIYDYIGQRVTAFCSKRSSYEVKYFEELDNNIKVINPNEILSIATNYIEYYSNNNKTERITFSYETALIYNGEILKNYTSSVLNPFKTNNLDGCIKVIDNNSDKKADVIMIEAYETFLCAGVYDNIAVSKIVKGKSANFDELGENTVAVLNAVGQPISYEQITEDDVLNCYYTLGGKLKKVVVTINFGSGTIGEIEKEGNNIKALYISGNRYECGASFNLSPDSSSLKPGDEVTFWFNKDAKIGVIEKGTMKTKLAILTDYAKPQGLSKEYKVRLFETGGTFSEYVLAEKIKVATGTIEAKNFENYVGKTNDRVTRQLIKYGLNAQGQLNAIIIADSNKDVDGNYTSDFFIYDGFDGNSQNSYREELYTFGLKIFLGNNTKVFALPEESNRDIDDAYAIKPIGVFGSGNHTITAYGTNKYSPVADAVVYYSAVTSEDASSSTRYLVVSNISQSIDENGDEFVKVSGYYGDTGVKGEIGYVKAESIDDLKIAPNGSLVAPGDVIKYTTDVTGLLKNAVLILDKSENKLYNMNNPNGAFPATAIRYSYGDVVSTDGSYITVELKNTNNTITRESYPIYRFTESGTLGTINERTGEISYTTPKASDILDRDTYGSKCTKVFTNINGPWWIFGILYN